MVEAVVGIMVEAAVGRGRKGGVEGTVVEEVVERVGVVRDDQVTGRAGIGETMEVGGEDEGEAVGLVVAGHDPTTREQL